MGASVGKTSHSTTSRTLTFVRPARISPRRASWSIMGRSFSTELKEVGAGRHAPVITHFCNKIGQQADIHRRQTNCVAIAGHQTRLRGLHVAIAIRSMSLSAD